MPSERLSRSLFSLWIPSVPSQSLQALLASPSNAVGSPSNCTALPPTTRMPSLASAAYSEGNKRVLPNPDMPWCEGIHVAALHSQTGIAEVLHYHGACMSDENGNQPVHISSRSGHVSFTSFLPILSKGTSVDCRNSTGETSLRLATD